MDHPAKLMAALALALAGSAHAGYAQLKPPPGWSPGRYAPAANDATFGPVIHSPSGPTTTVGGQAVKMPASYRLAANAPRVAAGIIFANPYLRVGVAIATWLGVAGIVYDTATGLWKQIDVGYSTTDMVTVFGQTSVNDCKAWGASQMVGGIYTSYSGEACAMTVAPYKDAQDFRNHCGVSPTPQIECYALGKRNQVWEYRYGPKLTGTREKPLTKEEFEEELAPKPMPERVPLELPKPSPLPIEQPSPWINPEPGPNPQHRPLFVPTGDPVPNPQYDPNAAPSPANQPFIQPGVRVLPSPTAIEPWRVDMQPVNRPAPTNQPMPGPEPQPVPNPQDPGAENGDKPKPEEQQSLCEKHPDIVACAKLGEAPEAKPVPNENKDMTITPDSGWGEGSGSCPSPKTVQVHGFQLSMPFDLLCQFASGIRPVVIGLAWLAAAFTFMGLGRRE